MTRPGGSVVRFYKPGLARHALKGALVLSLVIAGFEGLPTATADETTYTYQNESICTGGTDTVYYTDIGKTNLVVDFGGIADAAVTAVTFGDGTALTCVDRVASVEFRNTADNRIKTLTVSEKAFYLYANSPPLAAIKFPTGLTELFIGPDAFSQWSSPLETLAFPDGLKVLDIGARAFYQWDTFTMVNLKTLTFPIGVETMHIGEWAFAHAAKNMSGLFLKEVRFPEGLKTLTIDDHAFCDGALGSVIETVTFPSTLERLEVGDYAFQQHYEAHLTEVKFPPNLRYLSLGKYAFTQAPASTGGSTTLTSVTFPDEMDTLLIAEGAFYQHSATATLLGPIKFPSGLKELTIGESAFYQWAVNGSIALTSVTFPDDLPILHIEREAFKQWTQYSGQVGLESVHFPTSLTELTIGYQAFYQYSIVGSTALKSIEFPESLAELTIDEWAFYQRTFTAATSLESVRFPSTLQKLNIGAEAFRQRGDTGGSTALKRFVFPAAERPSETELELGQWITWLYTDAGRNSVLPWFWLGTNNVQTKGVWDTTGSGNFMLYAYAAVTFDPNGGALQLPGVGAGKTFTEEVFPEWTSYSPTFNFTPQPLPDIELTPYIPVGSDADTQLFGTDFAWEFTGWSDAGGAVPDEGLVLPDAETLQPEFGAVTLTAHWEGEWNAPTAQLNAGETKELFAALTRANPTAGAVALRELAATADIADLVTIAASGALSFDATDLAEGDYEFSVVYTFDDGYVLRVNYSVTVMADVPGEEPGEEPEEPGEEPEEPGEEPEEPGEEPEEPGEKPDEEPGEEPGGEEPSEDPDGEKPEIIVTGGFSADSENSGLPGFSLLLLAGGAGLLAHSRRAGGLKIA
jgi:hypothetical protein